MLYMIFYNYQNHLLINERSTWEVYNVKNYDAWFTVLICLAKPLSIVNNQAKLYLIRSKTSQIQN